MLVKIIDFLNTIETIFDINYKKYRVTLVTLYFLTISLYFRVSLCDGIIV